MVVKEEVVLSIATSYSLFFSLSMEGVGCIDMDEKKTKKMEHENEASYKNDDDDDDDEEEEEEDIEKEGMSSVADYLGSFYISYHGGLKGIIVFNFLNLIFVITISLASVALTLSLFSIRLMLFRSAAITNMLHWSLIEFF